MIPRTFPSTFAANGQQQMVVYSLPSITGLTAWIDYIPVKGVTTESATLENTYANGGYQAVDSLASLTGKQAWLDYTPVYEDASYNKPWSTDVGGYVPVGGLFSIPSLFASGAPGAWYDPSDYTTLFQDSAGTTPVTAVEQPVGRMLDKSGYGNHAFQSTSASRPVLSARVNKLLATATLATQSVTTRATAHTLRFEGAGSVTLTGTAIGVYTAGTHSITTTAGTLTLTVLGSVTSADLRETNDGVGVPVYQAVVTSTNYNTTGFLPYLRFDGVDDSLSTNSISFTSTDKMSVFAGVRKLSDGSGESVIAETYPGSLLPSFSMFNNPAVGLGYTGILIGTGALSEVEATTYAAPNTAVVTQLYDFAGATATDEIKVRVNGILPTQSVRVAGPAGTGNFGNYPLYIGRRGGTTLPFNGQMYSMIIVGKAVTAGELSSTETWVNGKTGAYA